MAQVAGHSGRHKLPAMTACAVAVVFVHGVTLAFTDLMPLRRLPMSGRVEAKAMRLIAVPQRTKAPADRPMQVALTSTASAPEARRGAPESPARARATAPTAPRLQPQRTPPTWDSAAPSTSTSTSASAASTSAASTVAAGGTVASYAEAPVMTDAYFYRFGEVDEPAEPASEWNLTIDSMDRVSLDRLQFDVWIDEHGRILACSLLNAADLDSDRRAALETQLMSTVLRPATRHGYPVASLRRVEIYIDNELADPPTP